MDFFNSAVDVLQTLVIALGAGLGIWGGINLMEGYGNDNPRRECSCTVEKHKAKQRQPALPLFRSQGNAIEKFIAVCYT